jgi:hypothetical protein
MKTIEYYTVGQNDSAASILRRLDKRYNLSNIYPISQPVSFMGNAKVLEIRIVNSNANIKVDGPGFIIDSIYNKLRERER